jgi:dTDP-4-amino-4,6-dideoxygalactose transaminase
MADLIPFNVPYLCGGELENISEAHRNLQLSGNGRFTRRCEKLLEEALGCPRVLLTHSCTAALEMAALLCDIQPGDEIIMPSFTFVSTANAFVLRGGVPVFVDIRPDTLNLDERRIAAALTPRTKAIVPVHYAGVACAMDEILDIADRHKLFVIEDAAHALPAYHNGKALGTLGHLGAYSFHETKNIIAGEAGALAINDPRFLDRAQMLREKGTDRHRFLTGEVARYTWQDIGSSYVPGEIVAAFLAAQLEHMEEITRRRLAIWDTYHGGLVDLEAAGLLRRPIVPATARHNAHLYYLLLATPQMRTRFIEHLATQGIHSVFHYVPLHDSPAGRRWGRAAGPLLVTHTVSRRLVRLPLWLGLESRQRRILGEICGALTRPDGVGHAA